MVRFSFITGALVCCLLSFSCSDKGKGAVEAEEIPADSLISPEKMALIMSDVYTVEASMVLQRSEEHEPVEKSAFYYAGIFRKYHISKTRYDQNITHYKADPASFTRIHEDAIRILEERQKRVTHQK